MFWFVRYKIPYSVSPERAYIQLAETVQREPWKRIVVTGDATRVKLHHKLPPLVHNSWNPIFDGKFKSTNGSAELVGCFRINWLVLVVIAIFIGICIHQVYETWVMPEQVPGYVAGWKEHRLAFDLQFLGMAVLINLAGWGFGLRYQIQMLSAIKASASDA